MTTITAPTAADYQAAFDAERVNVYPVVDAFEARMGFTINRDRLEAAARVLACPLKKSPPNWQHGRVLYAAARHYFTTKLTSGADLIDIGTAKGFSALCLLWARIDADIPMTVWSCDVLDPMASVRRNTVAEVDGQKTLMGTLELWPESLSISFLHMTGVEMLKLWARQNLWCGFAFIDGKHDGSVVAKEGRLLADLQVAGDMVVFDDVHLEDVADAVRGLRDLYEFETLTVLPNRAYAIGVRRG